MDFATACNLLEPDVLAMIVVDLTHDNESCDSVARAQMIESAMASGRDHGGAEFENTLYKMQQSSRRTRQIKEVKMVTPGRLSDYKRIYKLTEDDVRDANLAECDCGEIGLIPYVYERDGSKVVLYECPKCKAQQEV